MEGLQSQIASARSSGRHRGALRSACAAALVALGSLAGCGSAQDPPIGPTPGPDQQLFSTSKPAAKRCAQTVTHTLGSVAERVYEEADGGRIALQAVARLERSGALRADIEDDNAAGTRRTLQDLAESQIVRSRVVRDSHTLANVGDPDAIAPVSGVIKSAKGHAIATFDVSVLGGNGYAATLIGLIGAKTVLRSGPSQLGSTLPGSEQLQLPSSGTFEHDATSYEVVSFDARTFSGASATVYVLTGQPAASLCGTSASQTATNTLGTVGERIYRDEQFGGKPAQAVRTAETSEPFLKAVEAGNLNATRAAIIEFFANRSHVVRVRVYRGGKLFIDLGGPYVLAPASGTLRNAKGRKIGTFQLAIQDDRGYVHLAHNFTGAQVVMRRGSTEVSGTLEPGPSNIPSRGSVTYKGVRYQAFSFDGEAFPSGSLRISLMFVSS